jgi:hypothetical protein
MFPIIAYSREHLEVDNRETREKTPNSREYHGLVITGSHVNESTRAGRVGAFSNEF